MRMHVDETWREHEPSDVDHLLGSKSGLVRIAHKANAVPGDGHVLPRRRIPGPVVDEPTL